MAEGPSRTCNESKDEEADPPDQGCDVPETMVDACTPDSLWVRFSRAAGNFEHTAELAAWQADGGVEVLVTCCLSRGRVVVVREPRNLSAG